MSRPSTTIDDTFSILRHPVRRHVLAVVDDRHRGLSLDALAAALLDHVRGVSVASAEETATAMRTELRHVHLPRLADSGYVEYDRDADRVRAGPQLSTALRVLEPTGSLR